MNTLERKLETNKAEIICQLIFRCCREDVIPNDIIKKEFHRLRKAGFINYDKKTGALSVNYDNQKD